jgi:hypothetical protein
MLMRYRVVGTDIDGAEKRDDRRFACHCLRVDGGGFIFAERHRTHGPGTAVPSTCRTRAWPAGPWHHFALVFIRILYVQGIFVARRGNVAEIVNRPGHRTGCIRGWFFQIGSTWPRRW